MDAKGTRDPWSIDFLFFNLTIVKSYFRLHIVVQTSAGLILYEE